MRPLSERWPKPVLPIDGRPVIASLLRELVAGGFSEVTVVTGHLAEQVEELLGDGSAFGIAVRYARQPKPDGSADAVARALEGGARPPLIVSAADTLYSPVTSAGSPRPSPRRASRRRSRTFPTAGRRRCGA